MSISAFSSVSCQNLHYKLEYWWIEKTTPTNHVSNLEYWRLVPNNSFSWSHKSMKREDNSDRSSVPYSQTHVWVRAVNLPSAWHWMLWVKEVDPAVPGATLKPLAQEKVTLFPTGVSELTMIPTGPPLVSVGRAEYEQTLAARMKQWLASNP